METTTIEQFIDDLEQVQHKLLNLFSQKRVALRTAKTTELQALAKSEEGLVQQMRLLLSRRQGLLQQAELDGNSAESLLEIVENANSPTDRRLIQRILNARERTAKLRFEGWIHWIIANRAYKHQTEVLDLIANGGKQSPTYGRNTERKTAGGAIFDASI